ncbi:MAG: TolC family protein [Methyloprofundus sp.]|nr:TolC family protein [Methyloprofundus sp.]MDT8425715.1 TolC family protein [Methyloprofundus sp.]
MFVKPLIYAALWSGLLGFSGAQAEEEHIVDHVDLIALDAQLSLSDLINQTLEKYPDYALIAAMHQETDALQERGSRWISGAPQFQGYYKDDFAGTGIGAYEFDGSIQVPVWNWGQRDAGLQLAEQTGQSAAHQAKAIKLKVAGLVRETLWLLKLEDLRYELAKKEFSLAEQLMQTVQRRVDLGDLPRSDFLLAQSESLQKKVELIHQEAAVMHARKRYYFLTQTHKMPEQISEEQSIEITISEAHPELAAINATIAEKKARVEWIEKQGSGQTTVAIGGVTERGSRNDRAINSITFAVNVPFGGSAFLAPQIAAANRDYVVAETEKMHTYRALLARLHEAAHELEVELAQLAITQQMQANAEEHLKMADLSFTAGEINLTDFLRVQAQAHRAIKNAQESGVRLQRDIAFYNQALGVMP